VGLDGFWAAGPSRREWGWGEGPSLAIIAMYFVAFTYIFWLSVSIREVENEKEFYVIIFIKSHVFHIYLILCIFLSNT